MSRKMYSSTYIEKLKQDLVEAKKNASDAEKRLQRKELAEEEPEFYVANLLETLVETVEEFLGEHNLNDAFGEILSEEFFDNCDKEYQRILENCKKERNNV